jgi:myosin heavy subunit
MLVCFIVLYEQAAILHSLTQRFAAGHIYTFTANAILLAVNPFKVSACVLCNIM